MWLAPHARGRGCAALPAFHNEGQFCSISSRRIHRMKPPTSHPAALRSLSASARLLDMRDGRDDAA